jgi:hypothetical protein
MCQNHNQNKGLKVLRTYGIELEGYTPDSIRGNYVKGWNLISDGSLNDGRYECEYCEGNGNRDYECSDCYGHGHRECYHCDGYSDVECEDCCGGGEVPCDNCDCTGYVDGEDGEQVYCPVCEGSQYVSCSTCDGDGRVECGVCEGEGNIECEECGGSGEVEGECNECYGSGYQGDDEDGCGVECVSGVLNEGEYDSIDTIFDYISREDWFVNDDCGTHVHVGASDLESSDLAKLAILQNIVEPMIFGTLDEYRMSTNYCKKTNHAMVDAYIDTFMQDGDVTLQQVANFYYGYDVDLERSFGKYDHARYYGLNLHSYFYRQSKNGSPTVEFRYFEGCDDRELAKAWIDLCIKLVDFAKHSTFEQLLVIGRELFLVDDSDEYVAKVKELLGLEYDFEVKSDWSFAESKRNMASHLRTTHIITRAV